jgi:hypothetical protein
VVHLHCRKFDDTHMHIYIYLWVLLVHDRVVALLRFIGSVGNLSLLTIGDYYYHKSQNEMVERKWWPGRDVVWVLVGVTGCVPRSRGIAWLHCFSLSVSIKDRPLHGPWLSHRLIIPCTYLLMEAGRLVTLLSWAPALFGPTDWRRG